MQPSNPYRGGYPHPQSSVTPPPPGSEVPSFSAQGYRISGTPVGTHQPLSNYAHAPISSQGVNAPYQQPPPSIYGAAATNPPVSVLGQPTYGSSAQQYSSPYYAPSSQQQSYIQSPQSVGQYAPSQAASSASVSGQPSPAPLSASQYPASAGRGALTPAPLSDGPPISPASRARRPLYPEEAKTAYGVQQAPPPMFSPPPGSRIASVSGPTVQLPALFAPSQPGVPPPPSPAAGSAPAPPLMSNPPSIYGSSTAPAPLGHEYLSSQAPIENFESLNLGPPPSAAPQYPYRASAGAHAPAEAPGAGASASGLDPAQLPRPGGLTFDKAPATEQDEHIAFCHPRYMRMTVNAIPNSVPLRSKWPLPIGAIIHPLAEAPPHQELPVVNFGVAGVIRCRRCRTYINAFAQFVEGGRRWRCNLCAFLNDVPAEYFCQTDANGVRRDIKDRPELTRGSVEFVAPTEYMVRPPQPPVYAFVFDVSYNAVSTGMLETAVNCVKHSLPSLAANERTQVAFLTFDSTVHFYSLKSSLSAPQMLVVPETEDMFLPLPDDMVVNLGDSRHLVDQLLDRLPAMFQATTNIEAAFGAAMQATFMVLQHVGGKVVALVATLPSVGMGRLKNRADLVRTANAADRDKALLHPDPDAPLYKKMAVDCSRQQIAVDLFLTPPHYMDIPTIGSLAQYTGGQVYYYPRFTAQRDGPKLAAELHRCLTRPTAFEAVMRIRCTRGLKISQFHGHFFIRSTDLLALPNVDCDKAYAVQLEHEENVLTINNICIQCALLYTTSSGERRIRVHTIAVSVTPNLADLYKYADIDATLNLQARIAFEHGLVSKLEDARKMVQDQCIDALATYRTLCTTLSKAANQLIFPESLKHLPLYTLSLLKHPLFRPGEVPSDERMFLARQLSAMNATDAARFFYPRMYPIHKDMIHDDGGDSPSSSYHCVPLSQASLDPTGVFLLDDGMTIFVWVGNTVQPNLLLSLFQQPSVAHLHPEQMWLPQLENEVSQRVWLLIEQLRGKRGTWQAVHVVRQDDSTEAMTAFLLHLVEDKLASITTYQEFLTQIHRHIQMKL